MPSKYFEPWLQFQHATVRQLAFCIASPNLLTSWPSALHQQHHFAWHDDAMWQAHFAGYLPRLIQLERNPQTLLQFLQNTKSSRLGIRFEQLLCFWLQDSAYHPYEILGYRLQQRQNKQTLGELDFLLKNHATGQIEHWEVALKYYLAEANTDISQWYGLNRKDSLQGKLQHFSQQQFQFVQAHGYAIEQRYAVMKGQLYFANMLTAHDMRALHDCAEHTADAHEKTDGKPAEHTLNSEKWTPDWLNLSRRAGTWSSQLPPQGYYRLQRREWLCADVIPTSQQPYWYTDGLYKNAVTQQYQMLRLMKLSVPQNIKHA